MRTDRESRGFKGSKGFKRVSRFRFQGSGFKVQICSSAAGAWSRLDSDWQSETPSECHFVVLDGISVPETGRLLDQEGIAVRADGSEVGSLLKLASFQLVLGLQSATE